jgi:hypothetical protein
MAQRLRFWKQSLAVGLHHQMLAWRRQNLCTAAALVDHLTHRQLFVPQALARSADLVAQL